MDRTPVIPAKLKHGLFRILCILAVFFSSIVLPLRVEAATVNVDAQIDASIFSNASYLTISATNDYRTKYGSVTVTNQAETGTTQIYMTATGYTSFITAKTTTTSLIIESSCSEDIYVYLSDGTKWTIPSNSTGTTVGTVSASGKDNTENKTYTITGIWKASDVVSTTFSGRAGGTFTVTDTNDNALNDTSGSSVGTLDASTTATISQAPGYQYKLTATASNGYTFRGWMDSNTGLITTSSTYTYTANSQTTVYPLFAPTGTAMYTIYSSYAQSYCYLDEAIAAATTDTSGIIVVLSSGNVKGSESYIDETSNYDTDTGNLVFTLSGNQKLLVPYENGSAGHFGAPQHMMPSSAGVTYEKSTGADRVFRKLIVPTGTTIICQTGTAINVDAMQRVCHSAGFPGGVGGYYGQITLENGSSIIIQTGASLYCYGFVVAEDSTGAINSLDATGKVIARSGANVYELMEISDWRGGSQAQEAAVGTISNFYQDKADAFVFSQYYVQSISAAFTIESGATDTVWFAMNYGGTEKVHESLEYIGSGSLFQLQSGAYLTRKYDATTDRVTYDIYGTTTLSGITVSLPLGPSILTNITSLNTSNYIFPLQSNFTVNIQSGTTTVNQKFKMHPGCIVQVCDGAKLDVASAGAVYIYSKSDFLANSIFSGKAISDDNTSNWDYQAQEYGIAPCLYAPGRVDYSLSEAKVHGFRTAVRTWENTNDAQLIVNGELIVNGNVYSTTAGAGLSGTGKITVSSAATDSSFTEFIQDVGTTSISVYSLKGLLAGQSGENDYRSLSVPTYYGQANDYWYNHVIYADSADHATWITATAGNGTSGTTLSGYDERNDENIVGLVATNGTFTFTVDVPEGYTLNSVKAGDNELTPVDNTYTLTPVTADTTVTLDVTCTLISFSGTSVRAGDTLDIYFYVLKEYFDSTDGYTAQIVRNRNGTTVTSTVEASDWSVSGDYYRICYSGIAAKEMTDVVSITIYDANDKQVSQTAQESIEGYALRALEKNSNETLHTVLVDMLNYGAACQTYFGYKTKDLANTELTSDQKALATSETVSCNDNTEENSIAEGYFLKGATVTVESNLYLTFYFSAPTGTDMTGFTATAIYTNHYDTQKTLGIPIVYDSQKGYYGVQVTGLAIADGRQPVTCVIKDGETTIAEVTSSVENYAAATIRQNTDADLIALLENLMKFVDSANAYFHPQTSDS